MTADRHGRPGRVATAAGPKPRVFYDVGYIDTTGQIYGAGKGSFLAEMLDMLGVDVDHRRRDDLRGPARDPHRA